MSQAIDDLKKEHNAILSALEILAKMLDLIEKKAEIDQLDLTQFIGFLKEFTDKCHHGKEEGFLFPALILHGIADQGGPIGVMMGEHNQGRRLLFDMEQALQPMTDFKGLTSAGKKYIQLIQSHIYKENNVLFPLAEKILLDQDLRILYDQFERHESEVIGHGRHEALHIMLEALSDKYNVHKE